LSGGKHRRLSRIKPRQLLFYHLKKKGKKAELLNRRAQPAKPSGAGQLSNW